MTLADGHTNREWELLHRRFHAALIAACASRWLIEFHELLFDSADRHRRLMFPPRPRHTRLEHRDIMEAAVSRNVPLTIRLLNESMQTLVTRQRESS